MAKGGNGSPVSVSVTVKKHGNQKDWKLADDFYNMTLSELKKEAKSVIDAANKAIKRLEQADIISPALESIHRSGRERFTRAGDLKTLQKEYAAAVHFMQMKTSHVGDAKRYDKMLQEKLGVNLTLEQRKKVWEIIRGLEKYSPAGVQIYGSKNLVQYVANEVSQATENLDTGDEPDFDSIAKKASKEMMEYYEAAMDSIEDAFTDAFSI